MGAGEPQVGAWEPTWLVEGTGVGQSPPWGRSWETVIGDKDDG